MKVKVEMFIIRLILNIQDKHFPMIRWCGMFSNSWAKGYLVLVRCALKLASVIDSEK